MASPRRNRQRDRKMLLHDDSAFDQLLPRAPYMLNEGPVIATEVRTDLIDLSEAIRSDGTLPVMLINPGWGSSGYYGADVLEAAGNDRVFPRGTQMYVDHPGIAERMDRPERSVRDLAAVLETDGVWQANGPEGPGLYAQAKVFEAYRPFIAEVAPYIGLSIRAAAEMGSGEAEGRKGRIVERLVEAVSVDFVTKAGRGGQVLAVLESHRPHAVEAGLYSDDLRDRLRSALMAVYGEGEDRWCYVRDFNDDTVVFELYGDAVDKPGTYQIAYQLQADEVVLADGAPTEVKVTTTYTPVTTPSITTESQEDAMTPEEIKEAVAAAVKAEVTPIQTELAETKTKLEATEAELAEAKTTSTAAAALVLANEATAHVAANDKVKALPAPAAAKVTASLVEAAAAGPDGKLDTAKLDTAIAEAVDAEVKYLAEATGSPVRGVGGGDTSSKEADDALSGRLEETFKRLGSSDSAAKIAVGGRA